MGDLYGLPAEPIVMGMGLLMVIMLVSMIMIWAKLSSIKKRYRRMLGAGAVQLEEALIRTQEKLLQIETADRMRAETVKSLQDTLAQIQSKTALLRYNAFSDHGSDLSFSLALINDHMDGFVLTGIHSREQTYIYAKPIEGGKSTYSLTPEERRVIDQAAGKDVRVPIPV